MKKVIIIVISFVLSGYVSCLKAQEFYILLGSGFKNDTITLTINNSTIIQNIIVRSDSIIGYSKDAEIVFKNQKITYLKNNKDVHTEAFEYNSDLKIIILINKMPYVFYADLKKGKYLVLNKHFYYYNVYLNQYKKPIAFE
jgi:hypothetical protein